MTKTYLKGKDLKVGNFVRMIPNNLCTEKGKNPYADARGLSFDKWYMIEEIRLCQSLCSDIRGQEGPGCPGIPYIDGGKRLCGYGTPHEYFEAKPTDWDE